jgi:hypothetical protein
MNMKKSGQVPGRRKKLGNAKEGGDWAKVRNITSDKQKNQHRPNKQTADGDEQTGWDEEPR